MLEFKGPWACLNPDFPCEVYLFGDAQGFPSVTHALEASKSDNEKTRNLIRTAETPADAVALTKKLNTSQWRQTALSTAETLLRDKFVRYRHLRKVLLRTSGKDLIHTEGDFLGGAKKNHMGRLLMKIRDSFLKQGEDRVLRKWIEDMANVRQEAAFDSRVVLRARKDGREVSRHVLDDASVFLLGRQPESVVNVSLNHPSSSRNHAAIVHSKDRGLVLIDLGSSHGTTLNGKRLESFDLVSISNRCEIKFGLSTRVYSVEFTKGAKEKLRQEMYARLADNRDARVSRDSKRDSEDADNVVFVNNLPGDTTEMQLRKLFERSGM